MPQLDTDLITQADYARHRACTREAVRKAVAAGRISAFGPDQRINAALADSQWAQNTRPRANPASTARAAVGQPPSSPGAAAAPPHDVAPGVPGYDVSRARREQAEARLAELRLQRELRTVYDASEVRHVFADVVTRIRVSLEGLGATLAPQLVNLADEGLIRSTLDARIEEVLQNMSDGFATMSATGPNTEHDELDTHMQGTLELAT